MGIEQPLLQAPMAGVATPEMVAAVGNAGGLGVLPGVLVPPEELRARIRGIRSLSDRPFAVNLLLHTELYPPAPASRVSDEALRQVQAVLNRFRATLGLPPSDERPPAVPDLVDAAIDVIVAEKVPVFSIGLGKPPRTVVDRCHAGGIKVIAMAATPADALELAESGVDAIVAQGSEAGGHRSTWVKRPSREHAAIGTLALVPQVVDAVRVPVVAAGGIVDGRGLAAALALGASGALLGTRFVATRESAAPAFYKRSLIERDSDATTVSDAFTGLYARVLRNPFTEEYAASGAPVLPAIAQQLAGLDVLAASERQGSGDYYPMYAGQGVGMIRDLPAAADVVRSVLAEARGVLSRLPQGVDLG
jgi:nitronate monooxygenase